MPKPIDRTPFTALFGIDPKGYIYRITSPGMCRYLGPGVYVWVNNQRFSPKQIAYIMHHGELPKFITHNDDDPLNMRKENLKGSDIHPRYQAMQTPIET
jgi:hypothetical protein